MYWSNKLPRLIVALSYIRKNITHRHYSIELRISWLIVVWRAYVIQARGFVFPESSLLFYISMCCIYCYCHRLNCHFPVVVDCYVSFLLIVTSRSPVNVSADGLAFRNDVFCIPKEVDCCVKCTCPYIFAVSPERMVDTWWSQHNNHVFPLSTINGSDGEVRQQPLLEQ